MIVGTLFSRSLAVRSAFVMRPAPPEASALAAPCASSSSSIRIRGAAASSARRALRARAAAAWTPVEDARKPARSRRHRRRGRRRHVRASDRTRRSAFGLPIGLVPLGTFNDLARTLAIPLDVEGACAVIAARPPARDRRRPRKRRVLRQRGEHRRLQPHDAAAEGARQAALWAARRLAERGRGRQVHAAVPRVDFLRRQVRGRLRPFSSRSPTAIISAASSRSRTPRSTTAGWTCTRSSRGRSGASSGRRRAAVRQAASRGKRAHVSLHRLQRCTTRPPARSSPTASRPGRRRRVSRSCTGRCGSSFPEGAASE